MWFSIVGWLVYFGLLSKISLLISNRIWYTLHINQDKLMGGGGDEIR
jgi:hypothetical protein